MILLSLVLVVVSATALAFGVFTTGDALVWTSLGAGLGAVALVTGSVVRRRRSPGAVTDAAGPESAGAVAVGPAPAGSDPAPTPSRAASTGSPPPPTRDADPESPPPDGQAWPWATAPPAGSATRGWSGHVPSVRPAPERPSPPVAVPPPPPPAPVEPEPEDGVERVAVRDALRVAQLDDEVVVEDGRPRYHLAGCPTLDGAATVTLPVSAARRGGFTPCVVCTPDRVLLRRRSDRRADPH